MSECVHHFRGYYEYGKPVKTVCDACGLTFEANITTGTDMVKDSLKAKKVVTSEPPKHSCTAEIIAELERLQDHDTHLPLDGPCPNDCIERHLTNRLAELKAKETQL